MKTNVCGESSDLKLSGLLSVLYTDGGEQTSLEGCSAKVAVIDGLGSQGLLEVLVVADPKDLEKPRSKFDLTQDSVRLLVLPPEGIDACLGKGGGVHAFQTKTELHERATLLEAGTADYHQAVDSLATSVWRGLVAPKNLLDALDQPVADRIFEDIMPRTMAPAQAVEGIKSPFIKEWRSVTREDYDLFWKLHFNPQQTDSKMREVEYDDLTALHKIVMQASSHKGSSCSKSRVVCQRVLEYAAVTVAIVAFQWWMTKPGGYWDTVKSSAGGNGIVPVSGIAETPVADGLYQALTTEAPGLLQKLTDNFTTAAESMINNMTATHSATETPNSGMTSNFTAAKAASQFATKAITEAAETVRKKLSTVGASTVGASTVGASTVDATSGPDWYIGKYLSTRDLYRPGVYVDPRTGTDLLQYRTTPSKCDGMGGKPRWTDIVVDRAMLERFDSLQGACNPYNATLACENLGVRNRQCFSFVSPVLQKNPLGLRQLWNMLNRMFLFPNNEQCRIRCDNALAIRRLPLIVRDYHTTFLPGMKDPRFNYVLNDVSDQDFQEFELRMKRMFPAEAVTEHKEKLTKMWFGVPCGSGVWSLPFDERKWVHKPWQPACKCPKLRVTCETRSETGERLSVSVDSLDIRDKPRQLAYLDGVLPNSNITGTGTPLEIKRCFYQCLTQLFSD
ncbi:hypothetical protein GNI_162680 [Gregarina niphandrodes]|uniref:Uncharacterized protein n=1 Tax=Gregarina niphandrodes TaxID=110365 RepID=A0A023AYZ2_GRENI|nr:hypothetical protein GNI_162680 [Gregarina niphandrodes]EZG43683.1 hypothetical protein GNI_162680 [Gregarina niphandrodes]|eukprot:XP_011133090.1 hypothetical protein GNI_162680 [Gregarina niphandrodes]